MSARRSAALILTLSAGLSACAQVNLLPTSFMPSSFLDDSCSTAGNERLRSVDWTNVRVVPVIIRQNRFEPMVIRVSQNEPYIFRFTNRDDSDHVFRSPGFFESISVDKVIVAGREIQEPCMVGIGVPPGAVVDMQFIPTRDGRYEFSDSQFGMPPVFAMGTGGVVYITVPRERIESPTNLRVVEPPPPVPQPQQGGQPSPFGGTPGASGGGPGGFPIDPSMQASPSPGVSASPLPGDIPIRLPGDDPITPLSDTPIRLPGDPLPPGEAPVRLPGDAPVSLPGDAAVRLPGDAPVSLPGDAAVRLPGDAPVRLPGDRPPVPAGPTAVEGLAQ